MSNTFRVSVVSFALLSILSCAQPPGEEPLAGAWKLTSITVTESGNATPIENPGAGVLLFHGSWYSQTWMEADRMYSDPPTDLEKLIAYDAFDASTGTYTYANQQLTLTPQVARDPRSVGRSTSTRAVLEGDKLTRTREQPSREDPSQMMQWTSVYERVK
ncbi:MAG: lipocalin-like domain-containing protein [candidate division Zixibacteria bacterium]|nr:lipocalin-like domain-containing protein [candidate division Zixibacteria bacterium]